jgi:hypothetical protein
VEKILSEKFPSSNADDEEEEARLIPEGSEDENDEENWVNYSQEEVEKKFELAWSLLPELKAKVKDNKDSENVVNACYDFCSPIFAPNQDSQIECLKYCVFEMGKLVYKMQRFKFEKDVLKTADYESLYQ